MIYRLVGKGRCATGKIRFRDEATAMLALQLARAKRAATSRPHATEDHVYWCPQCKGWHLTSQRSLQETA